MTEQDRPEWMPKNKYNPFQTDLENQRRLGFDEGRIVQAKALIAWGEEDCPGHTHIDGVETRAFPYVAGHSKRYCTLCWRQLEQEVERG